MGGARRPRLGLEGCLALLQEGRARYGFRRAPARPAGAHSGPAHFPRSVDGTRQSRGRGLQVRRLRVSPDQNGEWKDGYYPIAISNAYERRVSAAIGYLDPATRQRSNLTIVTDAQVSE